MLVLKAGENMLLACGSVELAVLKMGGSHTLGSTRIPYLPQIARY